MNTHEIIEAFTELGLVLNNYLNKNTGNYTSIIKQAIEHAEKENTWFTKEFIEHRLNVLMSDLKTNSLNEWIDNYPKLKKHKHKELSVAVINAGNIPLVGFHDFLSVLICGNKYVGKLSSKDTVLFEAIIEILVRINPELQNKIQTEKNIIKNFDAIIATGSNNSSRYFNYYFGKYPNIIRKSRNSVAVLTGKEKKDTLAKLADDLYLYFGLGCRNVSKIYLPENYDITKLLPHFEKYSYFIDHNKFANNYEYRKSILLINREAHFDNGFSLFVNSKQLAPPISVIYFDFYKNLHNLYNEILAQSEQIQCIVSEEDVFDKRVPFGKTQEPKLMDYADNIDTIKFLLSLK